MQSFDSYSKKRNLNIEKALCLEFKPPKFYTSQFSLFQFIKIKFTWKLCTFKGLPRIIGAKSQFEQILIYIQMYFLKMIAL